MDRHHYEVYDFPEEWQNDTMPVILDNGRGYVSYCILFFYDIYIRIYHTSLRTLRTVYCICIIYVYILKCISL